MVGEAIESVLAQSYRTWELIVVDDGSTDGTSKHLARYGANIRYVPRQRGGVAAARNYGVAIARGRYVAFLGFGRPLDGQKTGNSDGIHGATA